MKPKRPRKSHYLPKFYLSAFTMSGKPDGELFVVDLSTCKEWRASPENTAREKDLYVVDLGVEEDPDQVEKVLAMLEGEFARVLRSIVQDQKLPSGDDFVWFLNFVAIQVTRLQGTRKTVANAVDRNMKAELREMFSTPEGWAQFRQTMETLGHVVPDSEFENFKRLALSEEYTVDLDQTTHVQIMVKQMIDELLPVLNERYWTLGVLAPDAPDLLCSDAPVSVWPTKDTDPTKRLTVATPGTVLTFPLTRRLIAIARYERQPPILGVKPEGAALFNRWTCFGARQVISATPNFTFLNTNGVMADKAKLLSMVGAAKRGASGD
ncbi:DUF4238 domain-containing protein [Fimbriiglobus ruber]|uniref:DUF4238 domain-containing protein n=1 Tax=Fimbriiglobus ruber TaxID=1908690 RepID=A0A225DLU0_9BACT|nr:DUF4238 domain-containing protein [Fimbriiglobus ruber]OWK35218.1 hypothetical protein FRUB_10060 [Fimbriiglobus ruber]OWK42430.1 hypothetical protein FRUB_04508 [Fimbriiglobus ruber]